jgi:hypothetical protein
MTYTTAVFASQAGLSYALMQNNAGTVGADAGGCEWNG